jgi:hypothetical protein
MEDYEERHIEEAISHLQTALGYSQSRKDAQYDRRPKLYLFPGIVIENKSTLRLVVSPPEHAQFNKPNNCENSVNLTKGEAAEKPYKIKGISIDSKPRVDGRYQGRITVEGVRKSVYGKSLGEVSQKIKSLLQGAESPAKARNDGNNPTTERLN